MSGPDSSLPSYARPIVASRLPEYSNALQDQVRAAFQPNNFRPIAGLSGDDAKVPFKAGSKTPSTFTDFVYHPSPQELLEEERHKARVEHERQVQRIAGDQPFFAGYSTVGQSPLGSHYEYLSDPYDGAAEQAAKERWARDSKNLSQPFIPPGVSKALAKPTRATMADCLTALYKSVSEDWSGTTVTVLATAEDYIVVYFELENVRSEAGVTTYMNNALRRNETVAAFALQRHREGWGVRTEDGHFMFTLRPPWIRGKGLRPDASLSTVTDAQRSRTM